MYGYVYCTVLYRMKTNQIKSNESTSTVGIRTRPLSHTYCRTYGTLCTYVIYVYCTQYILHCSIIYKYVSIRIRIRVPRAHMHTVCMDSTRKLNYGTVVVYYEYCTAQYIHVQLSTVHLSSPDSSDCNLVSNLPHDANPIRSNPCYYSVLYWTVSFTSELCEYEYNTMKSKLELRRLVLPSLPRQLRASHFILGPDTYTVQYLLRNLRIQSNSHNLD